MSRSAIALFLALSACSRANLELGTQQSSALVAQEETADSDAAANALEEEAPAATEPAGAEEEPEGLAEEEPEGLAEEESPPFPASFPEAPLPGPAAEPPAAEPPAAEPPAAETSPAETPPAETPSVASPPAEPPSADPVSQECPEECPVCHQGECLFCRWQSSCPELGGGTYRCNAGQCERCLEDGDCVRGTLCDEELGRCFESCSSEFDCESRDQVCRDNICVVPDCVLDTSCDPLANQLCIDGRCEDYNDALDCSESLKCPSQFFCKNGRCRPDDDYACLIDVDCLAHDYCQSGRCKPRDDWNYQRQSGSGQRRRFRGDAGTQTDVQADSDASLPL